MQNVKFLHPIFLGKDPDKGKRNAFRPPGQKAFLPYALIIFPFAAMPQKSFKDPAPSLCIPARLPDGAFQAGVCSLTVRPALLKSHDPAVYEHRISDAFLAGAEGLSVCHGLQVSACDGPAGLSESFLDLAGDLQGPLSFRFQARDHTGPDQCPARCLHIAHACAEAGRDLLHLFFLQDNLPEKTAKEFGRLKGVIKGILQYAEDHLLISYSYDDVIRRVRAPKNCFLHPKKNLENEIYFSDELEALRQYCVDHPDPYTRCILLESIVGERAGELCPIMVEDIDLESMQI